MFIVDLKYLVVPSLSSNDCLFFIAQNKGASTTNKDFVGVSMLRRVDRTFCKEQEDSRTVCYLLGVKMKHAASKISRILRSVEETPFTIIHHVSAAWRVVSMPCKGVPEWLDELSVVRQKKEGIDDISAAPRQLTILCTCAMVDKNSSAVVQPSIKREQ